MPLFFVAAGYTYRNKGESFARFVKGKAKRLLIPYAACNVFLFAFLPLTLAGYYLLPRSCRNVFLTMASLLFYAWGEPKYIVLMLLSSLAAYLGGLAMEALPGRYIAATAVDTVWKNCLEILTAGTVVVGVAVQQAGRCHNIGDEYAAGIGHIFQSNRLLIGVYHAHQPFTVLPEIVQEGSSYVL